MTKEEIISYLKFYCEEVPHDRLNDSVTLHYKTINTLYDYFKQIKHCLKLLDSIIITPVSPNEINSKYELHNFSKQELYKDLYMIRKYIIENHLYF